MKCPFCEQEMKEIPHMIGCEMRKKEMDRLNGVIEVWKKVKPAIRAWNEAKKYW